MRLYTKLGGFICYCIASGVPLERKTKQTVLVLLGFDFDHSFNMMAAFLLERPLRDPRVGSPPVESVANATVSCLNHVTEIVIQGHGAIGQFRSNRVRAELCCSRRLRQWPPDGTIRLSNHFAPFP